MIVTFLAPNIGRAVGGIVAIHEFASGLARLGHQVHLIHVEVGEREIVRPEDITWAQIDPRVIQLFPEGPLSEADPPHADFVLGYDMDVVRGGDGLPAIFVQGAGIITAADEEAIWAVPCPKICTSSWLRQVAVDNGVPPHQAVHVPYGMHHERFRVTRPIDGRPPRVAMLFNPHPTKGARHGLNALELVKRRRPDTQAVLFGNSGWYENIPSWIEVVENPAPDVLVDEVYNGSRVFVTPSFVEGFGLAAIEAMACGCALVTTDNGGADDYAISGYSGLVSAPEDPYGMARNLTMLLQDGGLSATMARRGRDFVQRFRWDESARELEAALVAYGKDPDGHRRPTHVVDYHRWSRPDSAMFFVQRVQEGAADQARSIRTRDLDEGPYRYLWFGLSRQRFGDPADPQTALVVVVSGTNADGRDLLLDFGVLDAFDVDGVAAMVRRLVRRGLVGTEVFIADDLPRVVAAIRSELPGATWQRRRSDLMIDLLSGVDLTERAELSAQIRSIFDAPTKRAVLAAHARCVEDLRRTHPPVAERLAGSADHVLAYTDFPVEHWPSLWTNATQFHLDAELDRFGSSVGVYPSRAMLTRLVTFLVTGSPDDWIAGTRLLTDGPDAADVAGRPDGTRRLRSWSRRFGR